MNGRPPCRKLYPSSELPRSSPAGEVIRIQPERSPRPTAVIRIEVIRKTSTAPRRHQGERRCPDGKTAVGSCGIALVGRLLDLLRATGWARVGGGTPSLAPSDRGRLAGGTRPTRIQCEVSAVDGRCQPAVLAEKQQFIPRGELRCRSLHRTGWRRFAIRPVSGKAAAGDQAPRRQSVIVSPRSTGRNPLDGNSETTSSAWHATQFLLVAWRISFGDLQDPWNLAGLNGMCQRARRRSPVVSA